MAFNVGDRVKVYGGNGTILAIGSGKRKRFEPTDGKDGTYLVRHDLGNVWWLDAKREFIKEGK